MPIKTEDPQALEKLEAKLKLLIEYQVMMKIVNTILRSSAISEEDKIRTLKEKYQFSQGTTEKLMTPQYSYEKPGFQPWELSNNNQEIARIKKRIKLILYYQEEVRKVEECGELLEIEFAGGKIIDNVPENRLQIFFDSKPDADVRTKLKQNGFRWAPSNGAWQSYRNSYALRWAKQEFKTGDAQ